MEKRANDATPKRPDGERPIDAPIVEIDLNKYKEQILSEESWKTNKRNSITVFKSDMMRIVLIALHKGEALPEHTANGTISVHVLDGDIVFSANGEDKHLRQGQIVTLHERIPHSVQAKQDSIFLLTMAFKK